MVAVRRPVVFRVFIDGALVDEATAELEPVDAAIMCEIGNRQAALVEEAMAEGRRYLAEVEFWDGERVRFGDDERLRQSRTARAVRGDQLVEAVERLWADRHG